MNAYLALGIAIVAEVIATTALKSSESFTRLVPSLISIAGYGVALYLLTVTMKSIPTGVTYSGDPSDGIFNTTNFPNASAADLTNAKNLYYVLTGRVTQISREARIGQDGRASVWCSTQGPETRHSN